MGAHHLLLIGWAVAGEIVPDQCQIAVMGPVAGNLITVPTAWLERKDVVDALAPTGLKVPLTCGFVALVPRPTTGDGQPVAAWLVHQAKVLLKAPLPAAIAVGDLGADHLIHMAPALMDLMESAVANRGVAAALLNLAASGNPPLVAQRLAQREQAHGERALTVTSGIRLPEGSLLITGSVQGTPQHTQTLEAESGTGLIWRDIALHWIDGPSRGSRGRAFLAHLPLDRKQTPPAAIALSVSMPDGVHQDFILPQRQNPDAILGRDASRAAAELLAIARIISATAGDISSLRDYYRAQAKPALSAAHRFTDGSQCAMDQLLICPDGGFILTGWMADINRSLSMTYLDASGQEHPLPGPWWPIARPDALDTLPPSVRSRTPADCGFTFIQGEARPVPDLLLVRWGQEEVACLTPQITRTLDDDAETVVRGLIDICVQSKDRTVFDSMGPLIRRAWGRRPAQRPDAKAVQYGSAPAAPEVSIIVPLYGRGDFLEFQLTHFASDPDMARAELIYVVDDPRLEPYVRQTAPVQQALTGVPFKVIYNPQNLGYAGANNAAARQARAPLLLLLNSDVLPRRSGWLGAMIRSFAALETPGVLTPRLLYPDGSIQHAGMQFRLDPWVAPYYLNIHPGKGLPVSADRHKAPAEVPAGTGACLMVPAALYQAVGGLDEEFIYGDFEDSNLCLQVRARGLRVWYDPGIELYHLERQSIPALGSMGWREALTLYNAWLHTSRWARELAADTAWAT